MLDVQLGEDQCCVRQQNATQNLAALRVLCLNLLRRDTSKKCGLRTKQKLAAWDSSYLLFLLNF